jgi:hypothetical protein
MVPHDQQDCVSSGAGFAVIVVKDEFVISAYVSTSDQPGNGASPGR